MNSFRDLEQENEDKFNKDDKESIRKGIWSTLSSFKLLGQLVDVYVPKFVEFFIVLSGGEVKGDNNENEPKESEEE